MSAKKVIIYEAIDYTLETDSSSSDSESDIEMDEELQSKLHSSGSTSAILAIGKTMATLRTYIDGIRKQNLYITEVAELYPVEEFRQHFRMQAATFNRLVIYCESKVVQSQNQGGRQKMSVKEMVYIAVWYMANNTTLREMSDKFGRAMSAICNAVCRITSVLEHDCEDFIKWPTLAEAPIVAAEFQRRTGFPGVIGAIDGTHIRVTAPLDQQKAYLNRKLYHSINVLGICADNRQFTYVLAGYPGSVHDARVLRNSSIFQKAETNSMPLFPDEPYHVVGDSAYPCLPWLMSEIKGALEATREQRAFNTKLSSTRVVIEHAFGDVKLIWRRLRHLSCHIPNAVRLIMAACVLHNFCISHGDIYEINVDYDMPTEEEDDQGSSNDDASTRVG